MGVFLHKFQFAHDGHEYLAAIRVAASGGLFTLSLKRDGVLLASEDRPVTPSKAFDVHTLTASAPGGEMELRFGARGAWSMGLIALFNGEEIYRSHKVPHRKPKGWAKAFDKIDAGAAGDPEEAKAKAQQLKELQPSIAVDIALGIVFFFVARQFGLVTAALVGAGATLLLVVIQRWVKMNLLGGFATFGVLMALISAGLALAFQDDTFVKLRGTIMGLITASLALVDGFFGGAYLGKRFALYMSGLFSLKPQRAAFAMAGAGFALILVDLPLVFLLTTEQWIWYNAFLDNLVAIPIVIAAMYFARTPSARAPSTRDAPSRDDPSRDDPSRDDPSRDDQSE